MNHRDHRKTSKRKEDSRRAAMLEMAVRDYKIFPTQTGYSVESGGDNADSADREGAFEAVRPKANTRTR